MHAIIVLLLSLPVEWRLDESVIIRKPRIDSTSPITLPPDPDYDDAIAAFKERWSDPTRKIYVGSKLPAENEAGPPKTAAVGATAKAPATKQPPRQQPAPIDRAAMTYQCVNGVCQWVPVQQAPTKSVQTYQRRGIFRRWR